MIHLSKFKLAENLFLSYGGKEKSNNTCGKSQEGQFYLHVEA